jgi:hypothetical protein
MMRFGGSCGDSTAPDVRPQNNLFALFRVPGISGPHREYSTHHLWRDCGNRVYGGLSCGSVRRVVASG